MKPIHLEIQAFGAFADKQSIDFQRLAQDRLFLIHGATGAGKTTIFDAICFALYGETTGLRTGLTMRSQYAAPNVETQISFIFQVNQQYYYVKRVFRIKRGSENIAEEQVFAPIAFDGIFTDVPIYNITPLTKKSEIEKEIIAIIGFKVEQFKQLIILPQGKFQELLLSDVAKKSEILTQIFNAKLYENMTNNLLERKKKVEIHLKDLQKELSILLQTTKQENIESLKNAILEKENELLELEKQVLQADNDSKLSETKYLHAKEQNIFFESFRTSETNLAKHLAGETQHKEEIEQIKIAEKAENLRPYIEAGKKAKLELDKQKNKVFELENEVIQAKKTLATTEEKIAIHPKLKEQTNKLLIEISELEKLKPLLTSYFASNNLIETHKSNIAKFKAEINNKAALLENFVTKIENNAKEKNENKLVELANKKSGLEEENKNISRLGAIYKDVKKLRADFATQNEMLNQIQTQFILTEQNYLTVKRNWHLSQAAELATQLTDNQPCVVCGSISHPKPAQKNAQFVSTETHERALQNYEKARKEVENFNVTVKTLHTSLVEKENNLETWKDKTEAEIIAFAKSKQAALKEAQNAALRLTEIETENENAEIERKNLLPILEKLKENLATEVQNLALAEEKQKEFQGKIPKDITSLDILDKKIVEQTKLSQNIENQILTEAKQYNESSKNVAVLAEKEQAEKITLENLETQIEILRTEAQQKAESLGFKDSIEGNKAMKDLSMIETWKKNTENWEKNRFSLQEQLTQAKEKVENLQESNLSEAQNLWNDARIALKNCTENLTTSKERVKNLKETYTQIVNKESNYQIAYNEAKHLIELATLANGDNTAKMKFHDFVLGVFFKEVIEFANQRLELLSQGRYQLEIFEESLGNGKVGGLNLKVFDAYTGGKRLVQQLSGGETFFTSLALALGLADVAAARSGGLHLDAIFIDEGFGTLDPETLDLAIRTLMDLDGNYRMVGIISHVQDLKERIPIKLEVIKDKKGSRVVYSK